MFPHRLQSIKCIRAFGGSAQPESEHTEHTIFSHFYLYISLNAVVVVVSGVALIYFSIAEFSSRSFLMSCIFISSTDHNLNENEFLTLPID